jgi:hypothetical protein
MEGDFVATIASIRMTGMGEKLPFEMPPWGVGNPINDIASRMAAQSAGIVN